MTEATEDTAQGAPGCAGDFSTCPEALAVPVDFQIFPEGLAALEVCEEYFSACKDNKLDWWLATLHTELKANANKRSPGPFQVCNWGQGRYRAAKYNVCYKFDREVENRMSGSDPVTVLAYIPSYGKVPGYEEGSALGEELHITMRKEDGEWRVLKGSF